MNWFKNEKDLLPDWHDCIISPQRSNLATVSIPGFGEYVRYLVSESNRSEDSVLFPNIITGVLNIVGAYMDKWAKALHIEGDVPNMFNQIISREDEDFQMIISGLSYFGPNGHAMGDELVTILENDIPETIVELINEGKFDKLS